MDGIVKVHITLHENIDNDRAQRQTAFDEIVRVGQIVNTNQKRFDSYGIISGDMPANRLDAVKALTHYIEDVSFDVIRHTL